MEVVFLVLRSLKFIYIYFGVNCNVFLNLPMHVRLCL